MEKLALLLSGPLFLAACSAMPRTISSSSQSLRSINGASSGVPISASLPSAARRSAGTRLSSFCTASSRDRGLQSAAGACREATANHAGMSALKRTAMDLKV